MADIQQSINSLYKKLKELNVEQLNISSYNKKYLGTYINNYSFFMSLYRQLMHKAVKHLSVHISEATFVDYGGGCGILSYLAKEIGFKTVIYNDLYKVSANDAKVISNALKIKIDYFITGDIEQFVNELQRFNLCPHLICSFDVLEHIYNWKLWLETVIKINSHFSLLFMTSANSENPFIQRRIKKIHLQTEYEGFTKDDSWKEIDLNTAFFTERKKIIANAFPKLSSNDITLLAQKSRGLVKPAIEKLSEDFIKTKKINYHIVHPTNTCDPYTGIWTENLINSKEFKAFAKDKNLQIEITNALYGYSHSKFQNLIKYTLNLFIKLSGKHNLFFSPAYVLEMQKVEDNFNHFI